jgi:hypothetical protein
MTWIDIVLIAALMGVGFWLESINGKHGFFDELLTPFPMGLLGMIVLVERSWA